MEEKERCVCCGKQTEVNKETNIEEREHYIEGVGQLCADCYYRLYVKKQED